MPQTAPRDKHGNPLCVGDTVLVPFRIIGCVQHKRFEGQEARELMTLQAIGPNGHKGPTPRLDAIDPGLVELVKATSAVGA